MSEWGFNLQNVTAKWSPQGKNILDGVNFTFRIHDSETALLPLMGPSGQGKSTLLYLLAALKWPTAGTVAWEFPDGTTYQFNTQTPHLNKEKIVQLRRQTFGFAFQNSTLSPHLRIIENIAYPLLPEQPWKQALAMAEETFNKVLLEEEQADKETLLNSFPSQLSGGQRQRAALAQAIIHNPTVLFADEPTGQLDRHTRRQVMQVLKQWVTEGQGQRCLIWVTHHHLGDLDMMGINELLFIEKTQCTPRTRQWLEDWLNQ
ncbi:MAG: hypothetical protein BWK78_00680 [Thiotrichaceae bacterium IS1]|nr:MAG: hypothetical protein BWK78_00680 [Thiotrichaceae bacterium IS1]